MDLILGRLKTLLRRWGLLPLIKRMISQVLHILESTKATQGVAKALRTTVERATFSDEEVVHDLPAIAHYWDKVVLQPRCEPFGFRTVEDFYETFILQTLRNSGRSDRRRIVSIGAGNGDLEIRLAQRLAAAGAPDFVIECLDFNPAMLRRCEQAAANAGVHGFVVPLQGDFNEWIGQGIYDVVMANYSLHHVTRLEHLFSEIGRVLTPEGRFLTVDMIGRNGHARWPESLALVQHYWARLPDAKKYNHAMREVERDFVNRDASKWGFEGIRAQDILPELIDRFRFELFIAWGGLIDPFVDRSFGQNFDPNDAGDREFINEISLRNDEELLSGRVKPTQMFAVMSHGGQWAQPIQTWRNLTPILALRPVGTERHHPSEQVERAHLQ